MVACLSMVVAACGSGGGDTTSTTTAPPTTATMTPSTTSATRPSTATTSTSPTDGDEAAYEEALVRGLAQQATTSGDVMLSDVEARCVAGAWTDIVGTDAFAEADVAPADLEDPDFGFPVLGLDADQGGEMVDAVTECGVDAYGQTLLVFSQNLDDEQGACLRSEFDQKLARRYLIERLIQTDLSVDLDQKLTEIDTTCELSAA